MNPLNEKYNQIEDYLHGRLSGDKLNEFESMIKSNDAFAMEVQMHQLAEEVIVDYKLNDLRKELKEIANKEKNNHWKLYSVSGLLALGLATGSYFLLTNNIKEENTNTSTEDTILSSKGNFVDNNKKYEALHSIKESSKKKSNSSTSSLETFSETIFDNERQSVNEKKDTSTQYIPKPIFNNPTPKEDLNEKNTSTATTSNNPCENVSIQSDIQTKGSCKDQAIGTIRIEEGNIKGGKAPYYFSLNDESFQKSAYFSNLAIGAYTLSIKDINNCITQKEIKIAEIECKTEYAFNPSLGEVWNIPMIDESELSLKIMDQSGRVLFEKTIHNASQTTWDGLSSSNQELPMGNYSFVLAGKNGKTKLGYISIFR